MMMPNNLVIDRLPGRDTKLASHNTQRQGNVLKINAGIA
jgi:hypothetical protein